MYIIDRSLYNQIANITEKVDVDYVKLYCGCFVKGVFGDCYGCSSQCVSSCDSSCEGSCKNVGCRNTCSANSR